MVISGEAGIGKTRLARELTGIARATGVPVAWGRASPEPGAPQLWPWQQVVAGLGRKMPDVHAIAADPTDRFRLAEEVIDAVVDGGRDGLVIVVDDAQDADELSLLVLRLLADRVVAMPVLVVVTFRRASNATPLHETISRMERVLAVERIDLLPLDRQAVALHLRATAGEEAIDEDILTDVHEVSGGNPFFVEQLGRSIADGTWVRGPVPRKVTDVVRSRLDAVMPATRAVLEVAAVTGHRFDVRLVATAAGIGVDAALSRLDEGIRAGLVEHAGGPYQFVHSLTHEAVLSSLTVAGRAARHRQVALALGTSDEHAPDLARHWLTVAAASANDDDERTARRWAANAARTATPDEAARLYRAGLELPGRIDDEVRGRLLASLARACFLAGALHDAVEAAQESARIARSTGDVPLLVAAASALEAGTDPVVNAVARELTDESLAVVADTPTRARLLALRSHVAFYDTDLESARSLSEEAMRLARESGDDGALVEALRARQEASPGAAARDDRLRLANEMVVVGRRTADARTEMWGRLWTVDALVERGELGAAEAQLVTLRFAVERVGGPVSAWLLDRSRACVAQGLARFEEASIAARRAYDRMRSIEPQAARGAYLALRCAVSHHVGASDESVALARLPFESPPWFTTMGRTGRAFLLARAGELDAALTEYRLAGPVAQWRLPAFGAVAGFAIGSMAAAALGQHEDLAAVLEQLELHRDQHASTGAGVVSYLGPVELHLGVGALELGRTDAAVNDLRRALAITRRCALPGFVAESAHHLATALVRGGDTDASAEAAALAQESATLIRTLGIHALREASLVLERQLRTETEGGPLSAREGEVAALVAEGLTNRQIAERLYISDRTAQNHVQRILTKLGFGTRSQIAAWVVRGRH